MLPIGPKSLSPPRRAAIRVRGAAVAPSQTEPAQKAEITPDLVTITEGSTTSALKRASLNAGRFLLKNGLPFLGAAIAGPPGLVLGALATGAIEYMDQPDLSPGKRLKSSAIKALATSALAGGLGLSSLLWAPLGPTLQAGAAALGTGLAGTLDFDTKPELDFEINPTKFARTFKKQAQALLGEAGMENALDSVKSGFSVAAEPRRLRAQVQIVQTAAILNHHLGPGVAISLAGQIGREGVDSRRLSQLQETPHQDATLSVEQIEGVEVQRVDDLTHRENALAIAVYDKVYLDAELQPETQDAKSDFILGHEISHVRHKDSSAELAQQEIFKSIEEVRQTTGSQQDRNLLNHLENDLKAAHLSESRQDELRADAEGFEHALSRGHAPKQIWHGAQELFGNEVSDNTYKAHPAGATRLAALKEQQRPDKE